MDQSNEAVKRYYGEANSLFRTGGPFLIVSGIFLIGIFGFILSESSHRSDVEMCLGGMMIGTIFLIAGFLMIWFCGRVKKSYIEIKSDGVSIVPAAGEPVFIPFDQMKMPTVQDGHVNIESIYNVNGRLMVKNQQSGVDICNQIQSILENR